jgi:hypothetical protein
MLYGWTSGFMSSKQQQAVCVGERTRQNAKLQPRTFGSVMWPMLRQLQLGGDGKLGSMADHSALYSFTRSFAVHHPRAAGPRAYRGSDRMPAGISASRCSNPRGACSAHLDQSSWIKSSTWLKVAAGPACRPNPAAAECPPPSVRARCATACLAFRHCYCPARLHPTPASTNTHHMHCCINRAPSSMCTTWPACLWHTQRHRPNCNPAAAAAAVMAPGGCPPAVRTWELWQLQDLCPV